MTTFIKVSLCISFPADELGGEVTDKLIIDVKRYIREQLRVNGAQTAAEHFNLEQLSETELLEQHEIWWNPGRFGHKDPKNVTPWSY